MTTLNLAVVQFTPRFAQKDENLDRMAALVADTDADVVVFPELCTSGYFFTSYEELDQVAEPANGPTYQFLLGLANKLDAAIVAGFAERENTSFFNSCLVVLPQAREPIIYRKTHLFYKETHFFDPGDTGFFVVPVPSKNVTLGPMICYDWRFPESARILTLLGADVIVCPANLVTDAWQVVMPARAVENKVYLAVANRCGVEQREAEKLAFKGRSAIYDYDGHAIKTAGPDSEEVLVAVVDPLQTRDKKFNPLNDVLSDRRPQHYSPLTKL